MSDPLLCEDSHLDRRVVIKALKPGVQPKRLLDELAALSAIRSRYVVQVYDVIVDGSAVIGFVEEYIDGPALKPLKSATTKVAALKAIYPIAAGIADIHRADHIHRDIKPENMKFDQDRQLKIFDFGLAKVDAGGSTGVLYFSQGYTAPEAFQANASGQYSYTAAVDVYSFGATALWLLNEGNLPSGLMTVPPTLPCAEADFGSSTIKLPQDVVPLLNRCLDADPVQRPTMEDVKQALSAELLRGRHGLLLTYGGNAYRLDAANKTATIQGPGSSVQIAYSGLTFVVTAVSGPVRINNRAAGVGTEIVGSSVIVLGSDRANRISVTADISHPEVLL